MRRAPALRPLGAWKAWGWLVGGTLANVACIGLHDYGTRDAPAPASSADGGVNGDASSPGAPADAGSADAALDGRITIPPDSPNAGDYDVVDFTATDKLTGLVWQQGSMVARTLDAAHAACTSLTLAGRTWRAPSRFELVTILDYASPPFSEPAFLDDAFTKLWTASKSPLGNEVYTVRRSGQVDRDQPMFSDADRIKCVSGPPWPPAEYQQRDGTVVDTLTGLTWQQGVSPEAKDHAAAQAYCATLALGSSPSGWRLPTAKELQSIVGEASGPPAIDTRVFSGKAEGFWTSTPAEASFPNAYWAIFFVEGDSGMLKASDSFEFVRCVR